jgi:hypothetical protein
MGTSLVHVCLKRDGNDTRRCRRFGAHARSTLRSDTSAIRSSDQLYYWDGTTLTHVTDTDLGPVVDMLWIDGYTMTTDGTSIIVTELNDPTSVLPLKYGSAEEDPDMVTGLIKSRDEAYALGQYTIQVFQNVGGNGFPFAGRSRAPASRSDASAQWPSACSRQLRVRRLGTE